MDLETLIEEADPARHTDPVDVGSDEAQVLYRQITATARRRQWNGPRTWVAAAAALLLVVGLGAAFVTLGSGGKPRRTNATAAPTSTAWRLVSSVAPGIRPFEATGGSPQGLHNLTCPTASACYLISSTSALLPSNAAYRSTDGGMTWLPIDMPSGTVLDTSFACFSATSCAVGAEAGFPSGVGASNVAQLLLTTDDGGRSWTTHHVPMPPIVGADTALDQTISGLQGSLYQVQCFSSTSCMAFGTTPTDQPEGGSDGIGFVSETVAMRTDDGGATWSTYVFPWSTTPTGAPGWSNEQRAVFSCPTAQLCVGLATVLAGSPPSSAIGTPTYGDQDSSLLDFRTTDGGTTWSQRWVPDLQGSASDLTCPDRNHCFAVTQFGAAGAAGPTGVLTTSDGGATWAAQQPFPSPNPGWNAIGSIACPTTSACWIAGSQQSSTNPGLSEGAMFATRDGGRTWVPVQLPTGLGRVDQVDCISARSCLAIGEPPSPNGTVISSGPAPSDVLTNRSRHR